MNYLTPISLLLLVLVSPFWLDGKTYELSDGKTVDGQILAVRNATVILQTADGKTMISLKRFSEADRAEIRQAHPEGAKSQEVGGVAESAKPSKPSASTSQPPRRHPGLGLDQGDEAPNFRAITQQGQAITLNDLRGRAVLVMFTDSSSSRSKQAAQIVRQVLPRYSPDALYAVGVSIDRTVEETSQFIEETGIFWPVAMDPQREIVKAYGARVTPTIAIVDDKGRIVVEHVDASELQNLLDNSNVPRRQ